MSTQILYYIALMATLAFAQDCSLIVPPNALTNLASVYQLTGPGCIQTDFVNTGAFVEAVIYDPNNAARPLQVYNPLVITQGTTPLIPPVAVTIPAGAVVGIWFGFNGNTLTLTDTNNGADLAAANCVMGLSAGDIFGQFSACNGEAFFAATLGKGLAPPLSTIQAGPFAGQPCPTTRSFMVVDQDQSDNVVTTYISVGNQTAQDTPANRAATNATVETNASDNGLLTRKIDPALACSAFKVYDLAANDGTLRGALALDELQATFQPAPIALIPLGDPMVLFNGGPSLDKANLYRKNVGQPLAATVGDADTTTYCTNLNNIQPNFLMAYKTIFLGVSSPVAAVSPTLFGFVTARYAATWEILTCQALTGIPNPINLIFDANGLVIDATIAETTTTTIPVKIVDPATTLAVIMPTVAVIASTTPSAIPSATVIASVAPSVAPSVAISTAQASASPSSTAVSSPQTSIKPSPIASTKTTSTNAPSPVRSTRPRRSHRPWASSTLKIRPTPSPFHFPSINIPPIHFPSIRFPSIHLPFPTHKPEQGGKGGYGGDYHNDV
ncbi:hypothetical protein SmJEL517_g00484 [Synchytrium microbalum]|uniref:Uncharacterized protein n=1 Tax=Synchytrium microbalum TaxID=1806994 RepID=A0A507C7I9_9FUNG|nr:uncharacterized protein SmJEL517_g00484 [Synchytrium microbalum]TPX37540.1 hypothetical protein SmJEL517_g00484 [Synchytrium microbalum]